MISIKLIESGKILHEVFTDDVDLVKDGWQLHPSLDRFYMMDGKLHITHGDQIAYLLREVPDTAVMEMVNEYNPTIEPDVGGFVAYSTDFDRLELCEYYNDQIGAVITYPYVKLVKRGLEYEGYGSQDGLNWEIRGAIKYENACKWGVFLDGNVGDELKISILSIYKDTKVTFKAIPKGGKVIIYDYSYTTPTTPLTVVGEANEENYEAEISVLNRLMPLKALVQVLDMEGNIVSEEVKDIWGGDVYHCGQFLDICYNGQPLDLMDNDFGYIDSFFKDFKLEIRNMISTPHTNVNVEIKKYYEEFGWEWVEVAPDLDGVPGQFQKILTIPEIPANGSVYFWVRITRSSVPATVDDYLFDFVINVW